MIVVIEWKSLLEGVWLSKWLISVKDIEIR